jgi:predicted dienelactone hydrolase
MRRVLALALSLTACHAASGDVHMPVVATITSDATPPGPPGPACAGALPALPHDRAAAGPSPVGARTIHHDDLTIEVWYPARPGSAAGAPPVRYDLRASMPPAEAAKIPDADNAWLPCACARDLPLDDRHGPYPVILFLHGAASFRAQSAFLAAHWASRGFVVIAPDLPGVGLDAILGGPQALPLGAPAAVLDLVAASPPGGDDPLAFARAGLGHDVAVVGHSLGSVLAGTVSGRPEVRAIIAMAGLTLADGEVPRLVLAGDHDQIAPADGARAGFTSAGPGDRLVIVHGAGHLAFSDLCTLGADRGGALAIARAHGVAIPELLVTLASDGCRPTDAPFAKTAPAIRAATAAFLEEKLRCDPTAAADLTALPKTHDVELIARPR